jgi:hypothetical protein
LSRLFFSRNPPRPLWLPAQSAVAVETVDVQVGSPLVSGRNMMAVKTRVYVQRVAVGRVELQEREINSVTFGDSF